MIRTAYNNLIDDQKNLAKEGILPATIEMNRQSMADHAHGNLIHYPCATVTSKILTFKHIAGSYLFRRKLIKVADVHRDVLGDCEQSEWNLEHIRDHIQRLGEGTG